MSTFSNISVIVHATGSQALMGACKPSIGDAIDFLVRRTKRYIIADFTDPQGQLTARLGRTQYELVITNRPNSIKVEDAEYVTVTIKANGSPMADALSDIDLCVFTHIHYKDLIEALQFHEDRAVSFVATLLAQLCKLSGYCKNLVDAAQWVNHHYPNVLNSTF